MSFGAELRAKLGLDTTEWRRAIARVKKEAADTRDDLGKALSRKVGRDDAFKGVVAAFGISIEEIAERIAESWVDGTRKGLEEISKIYDQETEQIRENIMARMPDDKARAAFIEKERTRAQAEENRPRASKLVAERSYNPFTQRMDERQSIAYTESAEDYEKRVASARLRQRQLEGIQIQSTNKERAESKRLDQELAASSEDRLLKEMSITERASYLTGKKVAAEMALEQAAEGTEARKSAQIELNKVSLSLADAQREQEQDLNKVKEEGVRLQKEQSEERKREVANLRQLRDAEASVADAQDAYDKAATDPYRISVQEAAAGQGGATQTSKARARQILSLEARAQSAFQGNPTGEMRDAAGNLMSSEEYAQQLRTRAASLRQSSGFLKSSDRDPLEAQRESLAKSEKHLRDIRDSLAQESSGGKK